jgi:hypothetical protein
LGTLLSHRSAKLVPEADIMSAGLISVFSSKSVGVACENVLPEKTILDIYVT